VELIIRFLEFQQFNIILQQLNGMKLQECVCLCVFVSVYVCCSCSSYPLYLTSSNIDYTGWGISRLTPLYPTNGLMAAVAPMSRISYSFTPNHYILRARCVRQAVRGIKGC